MAFASVLSHPRFAPSWPSQATGRINAAHWIAVRQAARRQPLLVRHQGTFAPAAAKSVDRVIPAEQPVPASSNSKDSGAALVAAAFCIAGCHLQPGEHLRVVGSCLELGAWDVAAAPALTWQPDTSWTADLSLPPGGHSFKLVVVRQDGSFWWEDGDNRELAAPCLAAPTPVVVTCQWGNPAATMVGVDPVHLQAAAAAAAAHVATLQEERQQLAQEAASLERQVQKSEAAIADMEREVAEWLATAEAAAAAAAAATASAADVVSASNGTAASITEAALQETAAVEVHAAAASFQHEAAAPLGSDLQPAPASELTSGTAELGHRPSVSGLEDAVDEVADPLLEQQHHHELQQQQNGSSSTLTAAVPGDPGLPEAAAMHKPAIGKGAGHAPATAGSAAAPKLSVPQQAPAPLAAHEQLSGLVGSGLQERNGLISFSFASSAAASSSSNSQIAELALTAGQLAEQRLLSLLPPQAAENLRQRLGRMPAAGNDGHGSSSSSSSRAASKNGSTGATGPSGSSLATGSRLTQVRAAKGGSQLTPSTRSGVALGGPTQPSAASSGGGGGWQQQQKNKALQKKKQPEQVKQQGQRKEGESYLPPDAEPQSAGKAAGQGVPPLTPPPEPKQLLPAMLLLQQQQQQQQQQRQQQRPQGEVARLPSSPTDVLPQGAGRSPGRHPEVTLRPSLPIAVASLLLSAVFNLGNTVWGVGRSALPPAAQRPADVAFWLLFGAAASFPLWK